MGTPDFSEKAVTRLQIRHGLAARMQTVCDELRMGNTRTLASRLLNTAHYSVSRAN
jgi:hypothetical protein